jgi:hypothetical protein
LAVRAAVWAALNRVRYAQALLLASAALRAECAAEFGTTGGDDAREPWTGTRAMVDALHRQFGLAEQTARRAGGDGGDAAVGSDGTIADVPVLWAPQMVALAQRVLASFEDRLVHLEAYVQPLPPSAPGNRDPDHSL